MKTPQEIINRMLEKDQFSNWLGIRVEHLEKGSCTLKMTVSALMLNGHHIAHGGISYALADSALAFAANSHGRKGVSIETAISHIKPVQENDELTAIASEINSGKSIGRYEVLITNSANVLVAKFHGTVFFTDENW